jgi:hypothetical protein
MVLSKMGIICLTLLSPGEGVVRNDIYESRYVCEQISKWQIKKFPTSILVMKSPSTESRVLKTKIQSIYMIYFRHLPFYEEVYN